MAMRPLQATKIRQRNQSNKSSASDPISSETTASTNGNGLFNADEHAQSPDSPTTKTFHSSISTADPFQTPLENLEKMIGDHSSQQETAMLQIKETELEAANEEESEKLREIEILQMSQDGLYQQMETLKKKLAEVTAVKVTDQGVRASPIVNTKKNLAEATAAKISNQGVRTTPKNNTTPNSHFGSSSKVHGNHPRKTIKRWKHSIKVFLLSFFALMWFSFTLLTSINLPTLETNLQESSTSQDATLVSSFDKKMKTLKEQLRRLEEKQAKNLAGRDGQTVLCCVARDEEPYIDEWVDYHLGIGIGKIVMYDNSEVNELKHWGQGKGGALEVVHYPGKMKQQFSYRDCANKALEGIHGEKTWVGFWDIDEFLVLKKHKNVDDFVGEYLTSGALGINWRIFGPSGLSLYQPLPVTKRFVCRQNRTHATVKSIARLKDMNMEMAPHVHFPYLNQGALHDTNGKSFEGPSNEDGPTDIAVMHHFRTKSVQEFLRKTIRGRADIDDGTKFQKPEYERRVKNANDIFKKVLESDGKQKMALGTCHNLTRDDSAWSAMKKVVPKYALYDALTGGDHSALPFDLENILLDLEF